jgi:type IX secretion system PorP/SprF family membrane protein
MKIITGFLVVAFYCPIVYAQQTRQYTQYMFNQFGNNPAVAGSKECMDIKTGYRVQWVGFEGAPKTGYLSFQNRIKQQQERPNQAYHGYGLYLENDQAGPISTTWICPAYAYHMPLNNGYTLSAGLFAGLQQFVFNNNLSLFNPVDNAVQGSESVWVFPDFTAGLWLYHEDLYAGLSAGQLLNQRIKGPGGQIGIDSRLKRFYNLTGGYRFLIDKHYALIPSAMIKYLPSAPLAIDINLIWDYRNLFAAGVSYRNVDAVAALVKISLFSFLDLGYSFDYTTSKIRNGSANSHEVMLSLYLCGGKLRLPGGVCPAYN